MRPRKRKKSCEQGEGFVKFCCVKKACVGDGRELERALDDLSKSLVKRRVIVDDS